MAGPWPQLQKLCEASRGNLGGTLSREVRREPGRHTSFVKVSLRPLHQPAHTAQHSTTTHADPSHSNRNC